MARTVEARQTVRSSFNLNRSGLGWLWVAHAFSAFYILPSAFAPVWGGFGRVSGRGVGGNLTAYQLREALEIDRRTLERWRQCWLGSFVESSFWRAAHADLRPPRGGGRLVRVRR